MKLEQDKIKELIKSSRDYLDKRASDLEEEYRGALRRETDRQRNGWFNKMVSTVMFTTYSEEDYNQMALDKVSYPQETSSMNKAIKECSAKLNLIEKKIEFDRINHLNDDDFHLLTCFKDVLYARSSEIWKEEDRAWNDLQLKRREIDALERSHSNSGVIIAGKCCNCKCGCNKSKFTTPNLKPLEQ